MRVESRLPLVLCLLLVACGYTVGTARPSGEPLLITVAKISEPGLDIDAAGVVANAVRNAVASSPNTRLVDPVQAESTLEVDLIDVGSGLAQFSEPSLRAAQYRVQIKLRGRLVDHQGAVRWRSPTVIGEAPYMSTPGAIEALDGARRRAMERAASQAAERLVAGMGFSAKRMQTQTSSSPAPK